MRDKRAMIPSGTGLLLLAACATAPIGGMESNHFAAVPANQSSLVTVVNNTECEVGVHISGVGRPTLERAELGSVRPHGQKTFRVRPPHAENVAATPDQRGHHVGTCSRDDIHVTVRSAEA